MSKLDPDYLISKFVNPDTGKPYDLFTHQYKYIGDRRIRKAAAWGRRSGKTTALALEACIWALRPVEYDCTEKAIILGPNKGLSSCLLQLINDILFGSGFEELLLRRNSNRLAFTNGRTIHVVSERSCGDFANMIFIDNADFVNPQVLQDIVMPILYTWEGTSISALGTGYYELLERFNKNV